MVQDLVQLDQDRGVGYHVETRAHLGQRPARALRLALNLVLLLYLCSLLGSLLWVTSLSVTAFGELGGLDSGLVQQRADMYRPQYRFAKPVLRGAQVREARGSSFVLQ